MGIIFLIAIILVLAYFFGKYALVAFACLVIGRLFYMGEWWSVPLSIVLMYGMVALDDDFF